MTDTNKPQQNAEMFTAADQLKDAQLKDVAGGWSPSKYDDSDDDVTWEPYKDPNYPVSCIFCNRTSDIWYVKGILGIDALSMFWCKLCNCKFWYNQITEHGASSDW